MTNEQIRAGNDIFNKLCQTIQWVILVAQMQSGKTGTFLFVAAEMFREKVVKQVIIMCGNSEKELKEQLVKDMKEFKPKYRNYLREVLNISEVERDNIIDGLDEVIHFKFGSELDAKHDETTEITDTLFIWEESHFGSGKSNRPNKFLERMGIYADGTRSCLENKNNYVLSVSATPYAEISDLHHEKQQKEIIRLMPGDGYRGVGYYLQNNNIIGFKPKMWSSILKTILCEKYAGVLNKYVIVRCNGDNNIEIGKKIAIENGWMYKIFDAENVLHALKTKDNSMMTSMNDLKDAPEQNTVIFIRGMCRMGKVVPKQHIVCVMETSPMPKTDTLLQSLLGRMCGYHNFDIDIYVSENILIKTTGNGTTELEKFVTLMENEDEDITTIPNKAAHLVCGSTREQLYDLLPVIVSGFIIEDRADPDYSEFKKERVINTVKASINSDNGVHLNGPNHTAELKRQLADPNTEIDVRRLEHSSGRENYTYKGVAEKFNGILDGREEKSAVRSMEGCGLGSKLIIWAITSNKYRQLGFPIGTLIVQAASKTPENGETTKIPKTTGKEAFTSKREDSTESVSNGVCALKLDKESATSIEIMKKGLTEIIQLSLVPRDSVTMDRCVSSVCNSDGTWQGILVNEAVYKSLQKGGSIYTHLNSTFGVKVKTIGKSGPCSKDCKASGLKRLCKIEW